MWGSPVSGLTTLQGNFMATLDELRRQIDALDGQLVRLLNERAAVAVEIGKLKMSSGAGVYAPDRETEVLSRVARLSTGPLTRGSLHAIYRELMSASFALERPPRVGYLGPRGSFTHEAALGKFGASVEYESLSQIAAVFEEMSRGHVDYGVVPVENSTSGAVLDTLDAFLKHGTKICCEMYRAIHHNLMASCRQEEIEVVYSKPEAFMQCQRWLAETGLAAKVSPAPSTSRAAEMAASQRNAAAIGSKLAAKLYGLSVLAENIEDNPNNATRFFVLGRDETRPTGHDRTSLMFVTAHKAGALVEVLLVFQKAGINLTMLTSRPSPKAEVEYNFFVDIDGHAADANVKKALDDARTHCHTLHVLGSYPKSTAVLAA